MSNIIPQEYFLNIKKRVELKKHRPLVIWFTGLSGSGKSTLANQVEIELYKRQVHTYSLDGDNLRGGLNCDLGFTEEDRTENLRRIAEVAKLFHNAGIVVLSAFITPLISDRELVKSIVGGENFVEVFVDASLEACERRDVKGLYKKARAGEIQNFTGISAPFEIPKNPDLIVKTENTSVMNTVNNILAVVEPKIRL